MSETLRLRRCINDLVSVLALPAMWAGHEASGVATTLLDVVVRMVRLDLAYIRVDATALDATGEWVRFADDGAASVDAERVGRVLESHLTGDGGPGPATPRTINLFGRGPASIVAFPLGLHGSAALFVAGSRRAHFPTETERLVLQVATNQAAVALEEARQVSQRRLVPEDRVRRVAERTAEFKILVDAVPQVIGVVERDGTLRDVNRAGLAFFGRRAEEFAGGDAIATPVYHAEDLDRVRTEAERAFRDGTPGEVGARLRRQDGAYCGFTTRYEPLRDEQGRILRCYWVGIDINDRKKAEERMRDENLALREEVDKASMFEEIVGVSAPLRSVLSQVAKVARTDSTVLITGETGTGKELVARAIHKRSPRSSRAFVSVNCAAIPPALIASELFGHEKGAFTGAVQRRRGRFELADGGTIFLDEIGELPSETQMALLRVLQEREFERVGGSGPIRVDVRVIAATNRDLEAAVADKTFRADLFYRLNVFPVEVPALRERRADIPLLVEYFIHRYATRAGKRIRGISRETSNLLQSYDWPGNIRELQNVIERAVIVSGSDTLAIDRQWLSGRSLRRPPNAGPLTSTLATHAKDVIETTLRESKGRVAGPFGAAARLGVPSSTLESKIKALKIDKRRFKSA